MVPGKSVMPRQERQEFMKEQQRRDLRRRAPPCAAVAPGDIR